jgi:cobalt/nickel transport system permease protein
MGSVMTHEWHDTYHHASAPAHHLDPRSKIGVALLFVGLVLFTPHMTGLQLAGYAVFLVILFLSAHLSPKGLLERMAALLPFALLMLLSALMSHAPLERLREVLTRSLLSIAAMALLAMATPFPDLLRALEQSRVPKIMILFLAFLFRYGAVLGKETVRLERGWTARYFGRRRILQGARLGHILAALLVRSYERAERIYAAMLARGFSAESRWGHLLHFSVWDAVFAGLSAAALCGVRWGLGA